MRRFVSSPGIVIFLVSVGLTASVSGHVDGSNADAMAARPLLPMPQAQQEMTIENARRITVEELRVALEQRRAIVIDVRDSESFKSAHIKGALHIPEDKIVSRIKKLPRNKLIVTYCS